MNRRTFLGLALAGLPAMAAHAQETATGWIRSLLSDAIADPGVCGQDDAAARSTLERLRGLELPSRGKVLVVNIPSGVVTAYEDGEPVIESRAVVGKDLTPTPEMDTRITYVRPNPTWTVPRSIIDRKGWRDRLAHDPAFFEENGFDLVSGGRTVSPWEAARDPSSVTAFIQRPGPENALGLLKIGLHDADAIYLHDTNEPSRYDSDIRAASAGCVRIEDVREIAAWVLGTNRYEIDRLIAEGNITNYSDFDPVRVILGYWTAWPDSDGYLRYYPDIYGWDGTGIECMSANPTQGFPEGSSWNIRPVWTENQVR